jgi:uncharacterized protein (TIGR02266 family)
MSDERRSSHRVRITGVRVIYESGNGERMEANAHDLGGGGLFIRTAAPLGVGKRISLEIQVIGESGPWSAVGRVVWSREKGEGEKSPPGMGVKLIDADEAVLAAIARLVESRERTDPGVGQGSNPPPAPVVVVAPERERTLMGVGSGPAEEAPPVRPREPSVAIDLVARKPISSAPPPAAPRPTEAIEKGGGAGRWVVILLLLVVAGVAAYVLVEGFLRHPPGR